MTAEEFALRYDRLSKEEQIEFLAQLMHELTVDVRGYYSETPQVVNSHRGSRVGNLNELQHAVSGNLMDVISEKPDRADGAGFLEWLMGLARYGQLENTLLRSLSRALSLIGS